MPAAAPVPAAGAPAVAAEKFAEAQASGCRRRRHGSSGKELELKDLGRLQAELAKQRAGKEGKLRTWPRNSTSNSHGIASPSASTPTSTSPGGEPGVRSDFAETLFWHPLLIADADGRAHDRASICPTRSPPSACGPTPTATGASARAMPNSISRIPSTSNRNCRWRSTPATASTCRWPWSTTRRPRCRSSCCSSTATWSSSTAMPHRKLKLAAEKRGREYFSLEVTGQKGDCELTIRGTAGHLADAVTRPLKVVPPGFPKKLSLQRPDRRPAGGRRSTARDWVPGSLEVTLNAFPSTLADLQKGLDGILQEPNGCFEQASTSNYPNVMSLQYMQEHDVADPAVTRRRRTC